VVICAASRTGGGMGLRNECEYAHVFMSPLEGLQPCMGSLPNGRDRLQVRQACAWRLARWSRIKDCGVLLHGYSPRRDGNSVQRVAALADGALGYTSVTEVYALRTLPQSSICSKAPDCMTCCSGSRVGVSAPPQFSRTGRHFPCTCGIDPGENHSKRFALPALERSWHAEPAGLQ